MLFDDDVVTDREAEARALASRLRRKERIVKIFSFTSGGKDTYLVAAR
jgi:hypothetical protein